MVPPSFPAPPPAGSVFAVPGGYLVFAGGAPHSGATPAIGAALVNVSGDGADPTVVQTTIAPAGSMLIGAAAAPTGQALVVWTSPGRGGAYFAVVTTSGGELHVGSPSPVHAAPDFGDLSSVAFDGQGFLVLGGDANCCPPTGLTVQRIGLDGVPVGGFLHAVGTNVIAQLFATVSTPKGAAVLWAEETPTPSPNPPLHASLITHDGAIAQDVLLPDDRSARMSELAWTDDRLLYVGPPNSPSNVATTTLRDFGWFGESAWETSVPGMADGVPAMGSGKVYLSVTDTAEASSTHSVYAVTPGGAVEPVAKGLPSLSILGGDGCGHVLIASAPPRNTGVPHQSGAPWTLRVLGSSAAVNVGSDLSYMYMTTGAFLAGSSSAGFLWNETSMGSAAPSTVRFATIGWH